VVGQARRRDEQLCPSVSKLKCDLVGRVRRVDRRQDAANAGDGVEHHRKLRHVGRANRRDVTFADPLCQTRGNTTDLICKFDVRDDTAGKAVGEGRAVTVGEGAPEDQFGKRQVGYVDRRMRASEDHRGELKILAGDLHR